MTYQFSDMSVMVGENNESLPAVLFVTSLLRPESLILLTLYTIHNSNLFE